MSVHSRRSKSSLPVDKPEQVEHLTGKRKDSDSERDAAIFGANVAVVFRGSACGAQEETCEPPAKALKVDSPSPKSSSGRPLRRASLRARVSLTSTATSNRRKSTRLSQSFRPAAGGSSMSQGNDAAPAATHWTQKRVVPTSQHDRRLSLQPQEAFRIETSKPCPRRASQQLQAPLLSAAGVGHSAVHRACGGQPLDDVTSVLLNDSSRRHSNHLSVQTSQVNLDPPYPIISSSSSTSYGAPAAQTSNYASFLSECSAPKSAGASQPDVAPPSAVLAGIEASDSSQLSLDSSSGGWVATSSSSWSSASSSRHSTDSDHTTLTERSRLADNRLAHEEDDAITDSNRLSSEGSGSSISEIDVVTIDLSKQSTELNEALAPSSTSCQSKILVSWTSSSVGSVSEGKELTERGLAGRGQELCGAAPQQAPRSVTPDVPAAPRMSLLSGASVRLTTSYSPLPPLTWADRHQVWQRMCAKDKLYTRSPNNLDTHPALHSRMRAILIDWICEVSEVYKLHRETFHLAVDYIDRYLLVTQDVPKQQLQLLGVTCLFIAAKVEEIYPPKLSEFAYVTDGACQEAEIIEKELIVVKTLSWKLSPLTCTSWLKIHLQLLHDCARVSSGGAGGALGQLEQEFVYQSFNGESFVQVCRLLDLVVLEVSSLQFAPSLISAAALSFFFRTGPAAKVSGYSPAELSVAQRWMKPFAEVLLTLSRSVPLKAFKNVPAEDYHNIQTKSVSLDDMDKVLVKMQECEQQQKQQQSWGESSPPLQEGPPESVLTPPKTDEKKEGEGESSTATTANTAAPPAAVVPYHPPVSFDA